MCFMCNKTEDNINLVFFVIFLQNLVHYPIGKSCLFFIIVTYTILINYFTFNREIQMEYARNICP